MKMAFKEALKARDMDEVPIGCVIVKDGKVIARGHNTRETKKQSVNHAEMNAIQKACKKLDSWRLNDCDLYVTLEPCPMCAGAIYLSRFRRVIYGASDLKQGAIGGSFNLFEVKTLNHHPEVVRGVMEKESSFIISDYFRNKRKQK